MNSSTHYISRHPSLGFKGWLVRPVGHSVAARPAGCRPAQQVRREAASSPRRGVPLPLFVPLEKQLLREAARVHVTCHMINLSCRTCHATCSASPAASQSRGRCLRLKWSDLIWSGPIRPLFAPCPSRPPAYLPACFPACGCFRVAPITAWSLS